MLISGWKQRERWYWDSRIGVMMFPHGRQVAKAYSTVWGGWAPEVLCVGVRRDDSWVCGVW